MYIYILRAMIIQLCVAVKESELKISQAVHEIYILRNVTCEVFHSPKVSYISLLHTFEIFLKAMNLV